MPCISRASTVQLNLMRYKEQRLCSAPGQYMYVEAALKLSNMSDMNRDLFPIAEAASSAILQCIAVYSLCIAIN
jgi:hypothetical protein